jgi:hypothetical protein
MGTNLKAILYAQGCQFTILFSGFALRFNTNRDVRLSALSSITLAGKVSAARSSTRALDVEVRYLSFWDHTLFSFSDGITQGFNVGKAPLKPGGRFQIQIPDFSSDRVTMQMKTHSWRSS